MRVARAPELLEGREFAALIMPCFAGPYHAYLHLNVSLRFLRCEPDLSALSGRAAVAAAPSADLRPSMAPTSSPEVTAQYLDFLDASSSCTVLYTVVHT